MRRRKLQGRSSSMADPVLKFPPEQKANPSPNPRTKIAAEPRRRLMAGMRRYRRVLLLVVLPLVALIAGLTFYLNGGRYVTTDDAYVGAQKVLITPDVSGKIISVAVKEGQQVSTGDTLFQIDPVPFQLALAQARAKLEDAKASHANLVANVKLYGQTVDLVDASKPCVDANPKESDFTYVAVGQPVTVEVDAFPNHLFKGTVGSLSPGTGAQFAILPPQNATGNFVKVVQRVPVRIYFDSDDKYVRKLKAGMSAYTTIDTDHRRSLAALLGFSPAVAAQED